MRQFESLYHTEPKKDSTDLKTLAAIADAHAFEVWGNEIAHGDPFPVYNADDTISAYVFPYAIGVSAFPADLVSAADKTLQDYRFGTIYVAAQPSMHPILRIMHSLHPLFVHGVKAETVGKTMLAPDATLNRIYWLGLHQEYFEVKTGDERILMDVRDLKKVPLESVMKPGGRSQAMEKFSPYWKVTATEPSLKRVSGTPKKELDAAMKNLMSPVPAAFEYGGKPAAGVLKLVPLPDCVPVVNWTWWCVPTAFTMAVCYYDNYNKKVNGGILDYGRLVGYWFDQPKSGNNVPDFIDQLIDPTIANWRKGFTSFSDFIKKTYGYDFKTRDVTAYDKNDYAWNDIVSEIDAGRPFVWGVPNHATCAFGYRIAASGKFVVIHTTWGDTPEKQREEWPHTKGTGLTAITPGGGTAGQYLEVWQPDGGETLLANIPTQIRWYVWGNEIKRAEIFESSDGGNTWKTIVQSAPCGPGWNYYDWKPSVATDRARVRIRGYNTKNEYIAGDGSNANIKIIPGPRQVTLTSILVKTNTDANGFFSAPHGLERYTPDGLAIRAISVAVQHKNGNWHTLDMSHEIDNRFWWNKNIVAGMIKSPDFAGQPVQIIIFAERIVG